MTRTKSKNSGTDHVIPALIFGVMIGMVIAGTLVYTGPIATRDRVIAEQNEQLISLAKKLTEAEKSTTTQH